VTKLAFPKRHKHADVRSREYLTAAEVSRLRKEARRVGRHGLRNDTMILLSELAKVALIGFRGLRLPCGPQIATHL